MSEGKLDAGLFIVATPIGNLRDITLRAIDTLKDADAIACEDTRVTRRLLSALDIDTPLISDPGFKLVRACHEAEIAVTALPGPSAVMTGLVLSGLPTDRFQFCGFLPSRRGARRAMLETVAAIDATLVFFESARRLPDTLVDMADLLGARDAAVTRELTKLFEEVRHGDLVTLAALYEDNPPKGEVVIVVGAPGDSDGEGDIDAMLRGALADMSVRDAAATVATASGAPRRDVYQRALAIAKDGDDAA